MAYEADLDAYDWNFDSAEMAAAAADGLLVSNHSYGIAAGWLYIGDVPPDTWWWIGGPEDSDKGTRQISRLVSIAHIKPLPDIISVS